MILSAQVWVQAKDIEVKGRISCELLEQIQHTLEQAGIDMPYRHLQLHLDEAGARCRPLTLFIKSLKIFHGDDE